MPASDDVQHLIRMLRDGPAIPPDQEPPPMSFEDAGPPIPEGLNEHDRSLMMAGMFAGMVYGQHRAIKRLHDEGLLKDTDL